MSAANGAAGVEAPPPLVFCGPVPLAFLQAMEEFLIQLVISVPPHAD